MTISPRAADLVRAIVDAFLHWTDHIADEDDLASAAARSRVQEILTELQCLCPHCGTAMTTTQDHEVYAAKINTFRYCPLCSTTVSILTPAHGQ